MANGKKDIIVVPKYLTTVDSSELGTDSIDASDIQIPRLKIVQGSSQIKTQFPSFKDSEFYNSVSNENYGNKVSFFVLLHWKSMVWFSDDFKLRCISYRDAITGEEIVFGNECEYCLTHPEEGKKSHNYMIVLEQDLKTAIEKNEMPFPLIFSCMSAAIKYARQLNGKLKTNSFKRIPIYGQLIEVVTELEKFRKGQAYMPKFSYKRYPDEKEFVLLRELYRQCKLLQRRTEIHAGIEEEVKEAETEVNDDNIPF